jgi:Terminase large subunit, T4likevirus-type, N-terminal
LWAREVLGYHPDPWQEKLLKSRSSKIILNCSRQSGKSTTCAALGLHESIYRSPSFGLVIAPSQDQSAELMMKFDEFRSAVELPSDYLSTDTKLAIKFANGNRFVARPGSEKTARSFSAVTLLLEDEASRVLDDLFTSVRPMLAVSHGRHILMSTPFGKRGHFFNIWNEQRDMWEWFEIPAEMCPRIKNEFLEEERRINPWFEQEYHCKFMETIENVFTFEQVASAVSDEIEPLFGV